MLVSNLPIPLCGKRDKRGAQQRQEGLCSCRCVCVCVCVCVCLSVCLSWAQAGQMQLARTHSQARSLTNASATLHPCLPGATSQVETPPGCPHPTGRFSQNKPTLRRSKVQVLFPSIILFAPRHPRGSPAVSAESVPGTLPGFCQVFPALPAPVHLSHFHFFWLHRAARGILVPQPEIEPVQPAVDAWGLNHWTTREVPQVIF